MKNKFHSELFNREITRTEKDFDAFVIAELFFRINKLDKMRLDSHEIGELYKYKADLKKRLEKRKK